jgi:hypothetical protein
MNICGKNIVVRGRVVRIARIDGEGYVFLKDPTSAIAEVRASGARIDLFTFTQPLANASPAYGYPMEWNNAAALRVSTFDDWWTRQIDFRTRNKVRKAEKKGVVVREVAFDETLVRGIWEIYNETPIRQGKRFPHYGKDLDTVRRMSGTFMERSVFFGAFLGPRVIGFAKLVRDDDHGQAGLMHILSMVEHADKAPTNALIARAVRCCAERGIPYLVYSQFSYGNKRRDSLSDFKEHNGFERIDVPRYYVPLSVAGHGVLRLGLHRGLLDRVPESLLARFRAVRRRWYDYRFSVHGSRAARRDAMGILSGFRARLRRCQAVVAPARSRWPL